MREALPLYGREPEMDAFDELLEGSESHGAAVMVRGEAGIGKSALLETVALRGHSRGMLARLLRLLAGPRANLMVVGDDQQAVYGFRGADVRNILRFDRDYPQAHVVRLARNYRSTPQIVEAANRLIAHNSSGRPKTMVAQQPPGPAPVVREHRSEEDEGRWAAAAIARATAGGVSPRD